MNDILFGNSNKSIVKKMAYRSLKQDKNRNLFIIITIVFTTTLLSAFCFYLSAQNLKLEEQIKDHYQAGCVGISQELIDTLSEMPEIEQWGISKTIGLTRYQDTVLSVLYEDENQIKLANRPAIKGRLPVAQTEIMVEQAFLQYLDLSETIGQTILLDLGDGTKQEYVITGIMDSNNTSRSFIVFSSRDYVIAHSHGIPTYEFRFRFSGDNKDVDVLKIQIQDFLIRNGVSEDKVFYSSNYFDMTDLHTSGRTVLYIVGLLLVIACSLVIYSLFYISVVGKIHMYGKLKVIGTTKRQLKSIVRRETTYLLLYSIPIGILLSGISLLVWMPEYWNWQQNLQSTLIVAIIMILAVAISTHVPIHMASRVSAIEAVRTTPYSVSKTSNVSVRLHRRITPVSLARMNFGRNRKKSALTFVSLGLTAIILMCVATYAVSFDVNSMASSQLSGANYQLTLSFNDMEEEQDVLKENPLNESLYKSLMSLEGIDKITRYNSSYIQVEFSKGLSGIALTGLTEEQMEHFFSEDNIAEGTIDYSNMAKLNGVIIDNSDNLLEKLFGYSPQLGDVLHASTFDGDSLDLHIIGFSKGAFKNIPGEGSLFYVTDETLKNFYPQTDNFNTLWHIYTASDTDILREKIFTVITEGRIDIVSQQDIADRLRVSADSTINGAFMIVAFLFVFALINLVNTLMTNLFARQQELSILQSAGMSFKQMAIMLSAECFWYVVITLVIAIAAGGPAGILLCSILNQIGIFGTLTYHFPWMALCASAGLLIIIQFCYSIAAVRYLKKRPLLERITSE